jgi:hypothetical protein
MWKPPFDPDALTDDEFRRLNTSREAYRKLVAEMQEREIRVPPVGGVAPDFAAELLSPTGQPTGRRIRLSEQRGRPVALVFGSYT